MAQYYQIVGQGHPLTLEDLQRYCPNICLDRIIVNQEDQQYGQRQVVVQQADQTNENIIVSEQPQLVVGGDGLQYQQQYIIRHEPPPPPPPPPPAAEFQQQQQQQQQRQLHHQVYYTSELPMDAQVVLQQAQQIIDASMMQQQQATPPRSQHLVPVNRGSAVPPSPAPPVPPPPPPPSIQTPQTQHALHNSSQPSQISRASPQLLQHLQQQQTQIHIQHQMQHQQIQQQQIQQQQMQHQQQMQLQQQQHLQQQQQQQIQHQQIHQLQQQQQHTQQIPHQQVVMHAAYINQQATPNRAAAPRLLNQTLSPSGVTLSVRGPVRAARPRSRAVRAATAGLVGAVGVQSPRLLNPQQQSVGRCRPPPRVLNPGVPPGSPAPPGPSGPPGPPAVRTPRPRTPNTHQLKLHNHQQMILNQQNQVQVPTRILTPQGTIVTQNMPAQSPSHSLLQNQNNGPITQQGLTPLSQRASPLQKQMPQQQIKKIAVQANNSNCMDDLEESITAAIVQKHPGNETLQQHLSSPSRLPHTAGSVNTQINYQQQQQPSFQQFEQQQIVQQPRPQLQQVTQLLMSPDGIDDDDNQLVSLANGQRMTLGEYKRQVLPLQQPRDTVRQTLVRSKEPQRPVQRVAAMPVQQSPQQLHVEQNEMMGGPSEQAAELQSAKMLIFLQNGEQRLITFTLPKESCTLQEVLEQVNIPFTDDTHIQCMQSTSSEIDYFVSVGSTTAIEDMLKNHPMLIGDLANRNSPSVLSQPASSSVSEMSTPEKLTSSDGVMNSPDSPRRSPLPKLVDGMLALCKTCGYTGVDFNRCQRCKRVFTEEPKSVPMASKKEQKKKDLERSLILEKPHVLGEGIKLNLLKTSIKTLNSKATVLTDKKPVGRVRKPRGKQSEPEPVILTLSSDEEDSNSSMLSNTHQEHSSVANKEPSLSEIEGGTPDSGIGMENVIMPLSAAEKMKRRREKLKEEGRYEEYKERTRMAVRKSREKKKQEMDSLPIRKKKVIVTKNKKMNRIRVQKYRLLKKQSKQVNVTASETPCRVTPQSIGKAVSRVRKVLPADPKKKGLVLEKLLTECSDNLSIVMNSSFSLDPKIISEINSFYQRDDISRQAPGLKDFVTVLNDKGEKIKMQIRHLYSSVTETHALFIKEFGKIVGRTKFAQLRPKHVYLSNKLPHNVCLCKYHENFILAVNALTVIGSPRYDHNFLNSFICAVPTRACWLKECYLCKDLLQDKISEYLINCDNFGPEAEVKWFGWADNNGKLCKIEVIGTINKLIQNIIEMAPKFFEHVFIKRNQASSYYKQKVEFCSKADVEKVMIQVDFSENYTCVAQDEVQSFHWVQPQVTLFTVSLWMSGEQHPIVLVSDNRHHDKKTALVYIDRVLDDLPANVKEVQMWSDGPASQFKNKYIAESMIILQEKHDLRLIWNYFATSHGKGPVDGIGGALKRLVRNKVLQRKEIVLNAEQFALAAQDSAVRVIVMPIDEIEERARLLQLDETFSNAPAIPGIAKCHILFWDSYVLQKSLISKDFEENEENISTSDWNEEDDLPLTHFKNKDA